MRLSTGCHTYDNHIEWHFIFRINKNGMLVHKTRNHKRGEVQQKQSKKKNVYPGIGIERRDITMSAHTQIGYVSAKVKKYDKQNDESTTETDVDVPDQLPIDPYNG